MSETGPTTELREGDVFEFRYSQAYRDKHPGDLHWCFEGTVIVRKGELCDTYWGMNGYSEPRIVKTEWGALEFVVNLDDVRPCESYEHVYYDDSDCFVITSQHGLQRACFVRKGAEKSSAKLLRVIDERLREKRDELTRHVRSVNFDIERLVEARVKAEAGNLNVHI